LHRLKLRLVNRLLRLYRLWLHRLLHGRLMMYRLLRRLTHRFFRRLRRLWARLSRGIRWLILVLRRLTRGFMLPMSCAGRSIDPMNTNFAHAVIVVLIDVVFTVIVITTGLHALQWAIAKHRRTLFTAGPETMYQ
jgi:hypothetical protein